MNLLWKYLNKAKAYRVWNTYQINLGQKDGPPRVAKDDLIDTFDQIKTLTRSAVSNSDRITEALSLLDKLHTTNPSVSRNYVWVLSTGRCGTLALESLLSQSNLVRALHRKHMNTVSYDERNEWFHRMLHGAFDENIIEQTIWRYLGRHINDIQIAVSEGKLHATINHGHVAFAPILSALFPKSRFLHLHGDPERTFISYYTKLQYLGQLEPLRMARIGGSKIRLYSSRWPFYKSLAWYIYITSVFADAVGESVGEDRYQKLNNGDLFNASKRGYHVLRDYFQMEDISFDEYKAHFGCRLNEKQSSITLSTAERERLIDDFRGVFNKLERE